ncbi:MAG: B12-binding domain-containing radical SAM protein [Candidatus Nealsonbacteria bacterium]|nr:B12-binding domain-containing radical SAM protein [Candidatus Nealsonbacteria bacterium]
MSKVRIKKDIVMLVPPARHTMRSEFCPLGVGIIAARLLAAGHRVRIIDAGANRSQDYWRRVQRLQADVFGIGGTVTQLRAMKQTARMVRRSNPTAWVFFGGPAVLTDHRATLLKDADALLFGEGEDAVPAMMEESLPPRNGAFGRGWAWLNTRGVVQFSGMASPVDLAALPSPAWELYPLDTYLRNTIRSRGHAIMHMMASRGCTRKCIFCDRRVTGSIVRRRPVTTVIDEMQELSERYHELALKDFYFFDPSLMTPSPWLDSLMEQLTSIGRFTWGGEARVDEADRHLLQRAGEAGCRYLNFGVEAATDRLLDELCKEITTDQIREAFQLCHETGIRPGALLMIGLPGQTNDDIRSMQRLLKEIRPSFIHVSVAGPFPGTALERKYRDQLLPIPVEEYGDYFPEKSLFASLQIDVESARRQIVDYYREHVSPQGYVNPIEYC